MKHVYRAVLRAGYIEVHFDFDAAENAIQFCTNALEHMTDREYGKECNIVIKKINVEQEKAAEAEAEEEDN